MNRYEFDAASFFEKDADYVEAFGRKVVERQQLLDVAGDLGDRLRELRTIGRLELLDCVAGVGLVKSGQRERVALKLGE